MESRGPEMIGAGEIILDFSIPSQKEGDRPTGNSTREGSRGATRTGEQENNRGVIKMMCKRAAAREPVAVAYVSACDLVDRNRFVRRIKRPAV